MEGIIGRTISRRIIIISGSFAITIITGELITIITEGPIIEGLITGHTTTRITALTSHRTIRPIIILP